MRLQIILLTSLLGVAYSGYSDDTCVNGRTVIVHLFNWKWSNIADECERFLGPKGFCGVQVSPVSEHRIVTDPYRPWWERYQTVSYKLDSRSGTRGEFADMVTRCNNVDVKIYADVVFNHMVGVGGTGTGTGGSYFDANDGSLSFPGVPFGQDDFNCCFCSECNSGDCGISNYGDVNQVRNCRLVGLLDLKVSTDYVRGKIADYLNDLISLGVAGFRVDACKHMWPGDIEAIYSRVGDLNTDFGFPSGTAPFIFNEVIDLGGEAISAPEYTHVGRVTEFKFSANIGSTFRGWDGNKLSYLNNFGEGWGFLSSGDALVFVDNHDNQRGHGAGGSSVLTHRDPKLYKMANAYTLAWPYGFARLMSSYEWFNDWDGPPNTGDNINDVPINSDGTCDGGWMCEHRWRQITNMVTFRNVANGMGMNDWWDNGGNQIAFARGNKGFVAFNTEAYDMNENLQTALPSGTYCDVISGELLGDTCTGKSIDVGSDGIANIFISSSDEDPMVAIHELSRVGSGSGTTTTSAPGSSTTVSPPPAGMARTVIFIFFQSAVGQDLFIRGGIDSAQRPTCGDKPGECYIDIASNSLGSGSHYDKYNAWRVGDNLLDWDGAESGQGSYQGQTAEGSPAAWTTNQQGQSGYQELNEYGQHYWMVDVDMNCAEAEDGWFELKAYVTNGVGWERDIAQAATCGGNAGGSKPYSSANHFGRCGFVNVFSFSGNSCEINNF